MARRRSRAALLTFVKSSLTVCVLVLIWGVDGGASGTAEERPVSAVVEIGGPLLVPGCCRLGITDIFHHTGETFLRACSSTPSKTISPLCLIRIHVSELGKSMVNYLGVLGERYSKSARDRRKRFRSGRARLQMMLELSRSRRSRRSRSR